MLQSILIYNHKYIGSLNLDSRFGFNVEVDKMVDSLLLKMSCINNLIFAILNVIRQNQNK